MSAVFRFRVEMVRKRIARAESVVRAAEEVLGGCEVYAFGSVVEGSWTGGSDVISDSLRGLIKGAGEGLGDLIEKKRAFSTHPFEIHLIAEKEAERYWKHAKRSIRLPKEWRLWVER